MKSQIIAAYAHTLDQAKRFAQDVECERFCELPHDGAKHPAWVLGHLALGGGMIAAQLEQPETLDPGLAGIPTEWLAACAPGSVITDDRSAHATKAELVEHLERVHALASERLAAASDAALATTFPNEAYRSFFPTVGQAAFYMMALHEPYHLGQLSAWRRAAGMAPVLAVGA